MATTTPSLTFPRSVFAKLSPHPYLLRTLTTSPDTTSPDTTTTPTRTNGRAPSEPRPLKIHTSALSHAHGSALVRAGDTTVICGVRAEILPVTSIPQYRPVADYEALAEDEEERERRDRAELRDYDLLVPNIELATGCAPQFLPGVPPSTIAQTVSTRVYSLLHGSGVVGVEGLRVWDTSRVSTTGGDGEEEEEKPRVVAYWTLYIDLLFVSYDGNPFDAAWTAVVAALRDTKLPEVRWDPDREAVVCGSRTEGAKALGVRGLPVACSAVVFLEKERGEPGEGRHWLLMDPDRLEEGLCGEAITVVVDCEGGETRVRAMEKVGGVVVGRELVRGFVGVAEKRWNEVKAAMK